MDNNRHWVPEISYSESDENAFGSALPLIHVPQNEKMPTFLLIWEARETGEFEPGQDGEELPVFEQELRQYARMDLLKNHLTLDEYNKVRAALGLEPLNEAAEKGKKITDKVRENLGE